MNKTNKIEEFMLLKKDKIKQICIFLAAVLLGTLLVLLISAYWGRIDRGVPFILDPNVFEVTDQDEMQGGFGLGLGSVYWLDLTGEDRALEDLDAKIYGSWAGDNANTGSVATRWYGIEKPGKITLAVYGSPNASERKVEDDLNADQDDADNLITSNELFVEIRNKDGSESIIKCRLTGHYTTIEPWVFSLGREASEFRIVAKDDTTDSGGWVGFSDPIKKSTDKMTQIILLFPKYFLACLIIALIGCFIYKKS